MSSAEHLPVEEEHTEHLTNKQTTIERIHQLEAVFEAMTDAVLVFDGEGNIVQLNMAAHDLLQVDEFPDFVGIPLEQRHELLRVEDKCDHDGIQSVRGKGSVFWFTPSPGDLIHIALAICKC